MTEALSKKRKSPGMSLWRSADLAFVTLSQSQSRSQWQLFFFSCLRALAAHTETGAGTQRHTQAHSAQADASSNRNFLCCQVDLEKSSPKMGRKKITHG